MEGWRVSAIIANLADGGVFLYAADRTASAGPSGGGRQSLAPAGPRVKRPGPAVLRCLGYQPDPNADS
jgi:hypothetical protein